MNMSWTHRLMNPRFQIQNKSPMESELNRYETKQRRERDLREERGDFEWTPV